MSLVTETQLDALRQVAYRGLDTPVAIMRRTAYETDADVAYAWAEVSTVMGWLRHMNNPGIDVQTGRIAGTMSIFRLHLRHDVDIRHDDRVVIGGETYLVQDVNSENTITVFRTAMLRRIE